MKTLKITAAALVLSLLAATSIGSQAMAQQGGVQIGGNANNTTLLNQNTNAAIGLGAAANTRVGSVQDTTVGGNLNNTTLVNQNTNAAIGLGTKACSEIGSIGKSDVCD
jgi:hypothetical protein